MNLNAGRRARGRVICLDSVVSIPRFAALPVYPDQAICPALRSPSRFARSESTEPERSTRCPNGDGQSARLAA